MLSPILIYLLKGVIYQEDSLWSDLLLLQSQVRESVGLLGLELYLDEAEGYAFLRSRPSQEDQPDLPRLVVRRPLSYPVSLLLALLRRKLAEFDASGGSTRLILPIEEIAEMMRTFLPEGSNEAKKVDQVESYVNKAIDLGFVRRLKGQERMLEVRRILKAFVDAQWLSDFESQLSNYQTYGAR